MATRHATPVPSEFRSVHDVITGLAELESLFATSQDRRGVFVSAHLITARAIHEWIERGRFLENELVGQYLTAFANGYRQALADYEQGRQSAVPTAWQQSFDASRGGNTSIIQDLLLGINAHINYDLPYAVLRSGLNVHCERCYQDHTRINDVLRLTAPLIRRRIAILYRRSFHVINWLCGWVIDSLVGLSFKQARENSWLLAKALDSAQRVAADPGVKNMIDARAAVAGRMILARKNSPTKCLAALYQVEDSISCRAYPSGYMAQLCYA